MIGACVGEHAAFRHAKVKRVPTEQHKPYEFINVLSIAVATPIISEIGEKGDAVHSAPLSPAHAGRAVPARAPGSRSAGRVIGAGPSQLARRAMPPPVRPRMTPGNEGPGILRTQSAMPCGNSANVCQ